LLWKEWREHRSLILAAWAIALVLPVFLVVGMLVTTPNYELAALGQMLPMVLMLVVWPVFAAATGATTVAADRADGSLRFLMSRPVSRSRIWVAKVGVAVAAFALIVAGSIALAVAFDFLLSGKLDLATWNEPGAAAALVMFLGALFISAHYCSLFFRRPLAAALAGVVVAASMAACVRAAWSAITPASPYVRAMYLGAGTASGVPLAMIGLLIAAWWVFSRGEILGGNTARRMAVPLAVVTVAVMLAGAAPAAYVGARSMASLAAELPLTFRAVNGTVVLADLTPSALSTQLAVLDLRSGEVPVVGKRYATFPVLSDDGSLIAYAGFRGWTGLFSKDVEIRVVRRDGTGDRAVGPPLSWWWTARPASLSISPDLEYVAVYDGRYSVQLEPLAGGPRRALRINEGSYSGSLIGWAVGSPSELLYYRFLNRNRSDVLTQLIAFDPGSSTERVVAEFPGVHYIGVYGSYRRFAGGRSWTWYPVWIDQSGDQRLYLIHTSTGEVVEVSDTPCSLWGFSSDGNRFVYGDCRESRPGGRVELRVRDLTTGADERFAVLDPFSSLSRIQELYMSPDGSRIAAYLRRGAIAGTYVIDRDERAGFDALAAGAPAEAVARSAGVELLAARRHPLGWLDDQHLAVVSEERRRQVDIEVMNVENYAVRTVYTRQ
jgi:hypothetical protein